MEETVRNNIMSLLLLYLFFAPGCVPALTHCKGNLHIHNEAHEIRGRCVVVSFWEYPSIGQNEGRLVINEVTASANDELIVGFSAKLYFIVWTPVFGFQYLNPAPGVIVFSKDYLPSWNIGGTEPGTRVGACKAPPKNQA